MIDACMCSFVHTSRKNHDYILMDLPINSTLAVFHISNILSLQPFVKGGSSVLEPQIEHREGRFES